MCIYIYICIYQSEGVPERLLLIPGCVGEWASAREKNLCVCVCLFVCVFVPALPTHLATHPSTHLATHLVTHPCRPPTRRPTQRTSPRHPLPLERPNLPFGLVFLSFRLSSQAFSPKKA